jgi:hypothetical protein
LTLAASLETAELSRTEAYRSNELPFRVAPEIHDDHLAGLVARLTTLTNKPG